MSMIRHPNIVPYLTTCKDPQSPQIVLLMELMNESLSNFLDRSKHSLPYYTQIRICRDVALALSYLHSIAIIHRDLSSNNVLLVANGNRAKVADFGMLKLEDIDPSIKNNSTACPGTPNYMPPEALETVGSQYSNKLDCFSFGVLTVQIATRKYPDPGRQFIEGPHASSGHGFSKVPEKERRKNHINLIEPNHPLLELAIQCLDDIENGRPSAGEIYEKLEKIDEQCLLSPIENSELEEGQLELAKSTLCRERTGDSMKLNNFIDSLQKEIEQKNSELEEHQTELKVRNNVIADLEVKNADLIKEKMRFAEEYQSGIKEKDGKIANLQLKLDKTNKLLLEERGSYQIKLKEKENTIDELQMKLDETNKLLLEEWSSHQMKLKAKDDELQAKILDLNKTEDRIHKESADCLTKLKEKNDAIAELQIIIRRKSLHLCLLMLSVASYLWCYCH